MYMKFKFPLGTLTNELLLSILPFGSGYFLEEKGDAPAEASVMYAVIMQSLQYHIDPLKQFERDQWTIN